MLRACSFAGGRWDADKDVVFRVAPSNFVAVEGLCGGEVESVTVLSKVTGLF